MDEHVREALNATKSLHAAISALERTHEHGVEFVRLKKLAARANKAVQSIQRHAQDENVRAGVRENVLREAVRDDLIDREANAARVMDKQRLLSEQAASASSSSNASSTFERAMQAAASVESSIALLCAHQARRAPGVALLAAATRRHGVGRADGNASS